MVFTLSGFESCATDAGPTPEVLDIPEMMKSGLKTQALNRKIVILEVHCLSAAQVLQTLGNLGVMTKLRAKGTI